MDTVNDKIIKNYASLEFELCGKQEEEHSNETEVSKIDLIIKKYACDKVRCGSELEYTVTVKNESEVSVYDIIFEDELDEKTHYVHQSFEVDGIKETPQIDGNTLSYKIEELKEGQEIIITFKVKIVCEEKEKSEKPTINAVYKNDKLIAGKGVAGASVEVEDHHGNTHSLTVDAGGNWAVTPQAPWPKTGDIISAVQTEEDKLPSDKVQITVL